NIAVAHHGDGWAEVWRCLLSSVFGGIGVEQPSNFSGAINTVNVSPRNRERSICTQSCGNDDSVVGVAQLLQGDLGARCVHRGHCWRVVRGTAMDGNISCRFAVVHSG